MNNDYIINQLILLYSNFKISKLNTDKIDQLINKLGALDYQKWIRPNLEDEIEEIERVSQEEHLPLEEIIQAFQQAEFANLKEEDWSRLENTDSQEIKTLDDAFELAEAYGKNAEIILEAFRENKPLPAPIVLELPDGRLTLVAGNTRLMLSKALGIRPKVLFINLHSL